MRPFRIAAAVSAGILANLISVQARADTFALTNTNGGDGFVNVLPNGFDLFGSDNGSLNDPIPNTAIYSATALNNQTFTVSWTYHTDDAGIPNVQAPPFFDPAGYFLN